MADILGDVLLVGITVILAAGAGLAITTQVDPPSPVHVDLSVQATEDALEIHHAGGEPVPLDPSSVILLVEGTSTTVPLNDCPGTATGNVDLLEAGETITVFDPDERCSGLPTGTLTDARVVIGSAGGERHLVTTWTGNIKIPP